MNLVRIASWSEAPDSVLARECGHDHPSKLCVDDLTTVNRKMTALTDIAYGGVGA
jgi:hypothetical protein